MGERGLQGVLADHLDAGVHVHDLEHAGRPQRLKIRHVREQRHARFFRPLGVRVDLIADVFRGLVPRLVRVLRWDQPEIAARQAEVRRRFAQLFECGDVVLVRLFERADADEAVGVLGGPAQGRRGEAAHPDRRPGLLNRLRGELGLRHGVVFALKRQGLALPQATDDFEPLVGARAAFLARNAEALELLDLVADAHAQLEPAAGDDVHGRRVFSQPHRVVKRQQHDAGTDVDRLGTRRNGGRDGE